ncbi:MAG: cysteine--tRNA ligase, partial [Wolbachia endosymbiont of Pissodes strobi]|nr:cysteine--tRNA ligase [Wolbachia endosymbiont of Pissodes strobi]
KKNNAYKNNNGDILFNINSYKKYGELSNRNKDSNIKYKINNSDFVLWKNIIYKKNEPLWKSPWGFGRPGWHIECSTISNIFLNGEIDIHGGGIDLLFPHHENEYAQSICAYKNFNIKRWIHVGSVNFLSKKMSKSLNNNISLKEIFKFFNPEIVRFFLTNKHYRKPLNYDINQLKKNSISINKLYKTLLFFNINIKNKHKVINTEFTKEFINAMNDDFNTPKMYSILFKINKEIKKINSFKCPISLNLANEMKKLGSIIGILQQDPINFIKKK